MRNYPKALKRKLLDTICQMRKELSKYTTDPKRDFTRNRKLPFETMCRTILSMSGQSLNVELQRQFRYDPTAATTSTFVQQRGKVLPTAFEELETQNRIVIPLLYHFAGLSQILCKHRNAVQIEQNLFKAEVAQAAAALFSK